MAAKKRRKKAGRKTSTKRKTAKGKRTAKKAKAKARSNLMPESVIRGHARRLKRNKRAAAIYRQELKCN